MRSPIARGLVPAIARRGAGAALDAALAGLIAAGQVVRDGAALRLPSISRA